MSNLRNIEMSSKQYYLMKIIKLSAIDSTNSFLKKMTLENSVSNFTVVITESQEKGRGQMNAKWVSEAGKNLTFSVFFEVKNVLVSNHKYLNFAVSLSVFNVLKKYNLPNLFIKWPNDIMAANKKVCGILIENSLKGIHINTSIVGIGLNVNQIDFPVDLPQASSLKILTGDNFNLDNLLHEIIDALKVNVDLLNNQSYDVLEDAYLKVLYKKNVPSMFKTAQNVLFLGKIIGVGNTGKLQIALEDETIQEFDIKEVSFA